MMLMVPVGCHKCMIARRIASCGSCKIAVGMMMRRMMEIAVAVTSITVAAAKKIVLNR